MRYAECHSGRLCFLWRLQLRERRGSGNVETIVGYRHYKYRAEAMQVVWNCSFHYINYDWSRAVAWPLGHAPLRPRPLLRPLPSHESSVSAKLWWVSIKSADLAKVRDTLGPDADRMWTLISIWFLWHGSGTHFHRCAYIIDFTRCWFFEYTRTESALHIWLFIVHELRQKPVLLTQMTRAMEVAWAVGVA